MIYSVSVYRFVTAAIAATAACSLAACKPEVFDPELRLAQLAIADKFHKIPENCGRKDHELLAISEVGGEVCIVDSYQKQQREFAALIATRAAAPATYFLKNLLDQLDDNADACAVLYVQAMQRCEMPFIGVTRRHREVLEKAAGK